MDRRCFIFGAVSLPFLSRMALANGSKLMVFKLPACGCCDAWIAHMQQAGFKSETENISEPRMLDLKKRVGITSELSSCHTAFVNNYLVEGHVPSEDVLLLLSQNPDALGLTVPGMPVGSPGMEMGNRRDPFDTLLMLHDGSSEIFKSHRGIHT
jgi:hypothetical protein